MSSSVARSGRSKQVVRIVSPNEPESCAGCGGIVMPHEAKVIDGGRVVHAWPPLCADTARERDGGDDLPDPDRFVWPEGE
jgi:hypothetical protein